MSLWNAAAQTVVVGTNKSLIDVFNSAGLYSVYINRIVLNPASTNGTGLVTFTINRTTTASAGTPFMPIALDPGSSLWAELGVSCGTNRTITRTDLFRQCLLSISQPQQNTDQGIDNYSIMIPAATVWDSGYRDLNVQPIICHGSQGVDVKSASGTQTVNAEIEFVVS
jgi:hypothetical protein